MQFQYSIIHYNFTLLRASNSRGIKCESLIIKTPQSWKQLKGIKDWIMTRGLSCVKREYSIQEVAAVPSLSFMLVQAPTMSWKRFPMWCIQGFNTAFLSHWNSDSFPVSLRQEHWPGTINNAWRVRQSKWVEVVQEKV